MQCRYGNYTFADNSITLAHEIETQFDARERPYSATHTFGVRGTLTGNTQAEITANLVALKKALSRPYQDFVLSINTGANSFHSLRNADTISGVRVIRGPTFTEATGAEYGTLRSFAFTVQGEVPVVGTAFLTLEFKEEVAFSGGGSTFDVKPAIRGPAQKQQIYASTPFVCVQQGHAVGYRDYPAPAAPLFPDDMTQSPDIRRQSPTYRGRGTEKFHISWQYVFKSVAPMFSNPSVWR